MVGRNDTDILGTLLSDAFGGKGPFKHSHCNKDSIKTVCRMIQRAIWTRLDAQRELHPNIDVSSHLYNL
jgi:hypothetical protein